MRRGMLAACLPRTTYYLPLATGYYLLLAAGYLLLATCYLLLATCYLLLLSLLTKWGCPPLAVFAGSIMSPSYHPFYRWGCPPLVALALRGSRAASPRRACPIRSTNTAYYY
jgi:hypothetical protein